MGSLSLGLPGKWKLVDAIDKHVVTETKLLERNRKAEAWQPVEQLAIDNAQCRQRQHLSQTLMNAEAERHMPCGVALHVESIRIRKQIGVAVRRRNRADRALACPDHLAIDVDIFERHAARADVQHAGVTQQFL